MKVLADVATLQKQSLHATVIRACPHCGEHGLDSQGRPVGQICPHCGGKRSPDEALGEIWSRRVTIFSLIKERLQQWWKA